MSCQATTRWIRIPRCGMPQRSYTISFSLSLSRALRPSWARAFLLSFPTLPTTPVSWGLNLLHMQSFSTIPLPTNHVALVLLLLCLMRGSMDREGHRTGRTADPRTTYNQQRRGVIPFIIFVLVLLWSKGGSVICRCIRCPRLHFRRKIRTFD